MNNYGYILEILGLADEIDFLAFLQKIMDRAIFLYIVVREVRLSCVSVTITIMHIRKLCKRCKMSFGYDSFLEWLTDLWAVSSIDDSNTMLTQGKPL